MSVSIKESLKESMNSMDLYNSLYTLILPKVLVSMNGASEGKESRVLEQAISPAVVLL